MLPGKQYSAGEVVRVLRHRWWLVLSSLALGIAAGGAAYRWLPAEYQSETVILVIPQRIPDSYVKSTVTTSVEDRLRSISEQIQSRSRLERIIQDYDLYKAQRGAENLEDVVHRMRSDIEVKLVGSGSSFRLAYISHDPVLAQKVTERLAALYIDENLRDRENLADGTSRFLESQLQDAKLRLIAQEKRLEDYRRRYAGQLPSQLQGNLQSVQNIQVQLQSLGESMNRARERRLLVERQIADTQTFPQETAGPATFTSDDGASTAPPAQQLDTARARLAQLKLRYTGDYPDVLAAEQTVRELEAKVDEEARRPRDTVSEKRLSPAELARRKRLKDLLAEQEVIDHQLAAGQAEEARLKKIVADYQAKIEVVPTRESELVELTRDYSTLQETYSSLLLKREDSKLAASLERRQIGEQFRILDPASLPLRPHNQRYRLAALFGGPLAGLTLGLLLVGLLEYRDSSFKCEDDVQRVLSLPVLALIPTMDEGPGRRVRRRGSALGLSIVVAIIWSAATLVIRKL